MKFWSHNDSGGLIDGPRVTMHGPRAPGTMLTWSAMPPIPGKMQSRLRIGIILGVHDGYVEVAWNEWIESELAINDSAFTNLEDMVA